MDEIRKKHALMECDEDINFQKSILNSKADEKTKEYAKNRIKEVEAMKRNIASN